MGSGGHHGLELGMKRLSYEQLLRNLWWPTHPVQANSLGPANTARVLQQMNNPDRALTCIQVAGTNGKGSVTHKLATALTQSGRSSGMFTSPHIGTFRERIQVDGVPISAASVQELLPQVWGAAADAGVTLSRFESLTVLALKYFQQQRVECAVLEAGLGGSIDATSAVESPLVSVVTSVALDHTHILGHDLETIAAEKAGVFRAGGAVGVAGPGMTPSVMQILRQRSAAVGVQLLEAPAACGGSFEHSNRQTAAVVLDELMRRGLVDATGAAAGLEAVPNCRFQELSILPKGRKHSRVVILDVAHNPAAFESLLERISDKYGSDRRIRLVISLSAKKPLAACCKAIAQCQAVKQLHLAPVPNLKAFTTEELTGAAEVALGEHRLVRSDEATAKGVIDEALQMMDRDEVLVVCGSFMVMRDARELLGLPVERDPLELY